MGDEITVEQALEALSKSGRKYVPESDLIAAKKGLEDRIGTVQADLATARSNADAQYQEVLRLQAAVKDAETKLSSSAASKEELDKLTKQLREATDGRDALVTQIAGLRMLSIHERTKIPMDELKGKTNEQLSALEEALRLVKPATGGQSFDGGGTPAGGTVPPAKGRTLIKEGLKARG